MPNSDRRPLKPERSGFDFSDVDPRETSKAWNRFLSNRNAPSLPPTGVRSVIYQSWVRSNTTGVKPEQFAAPVIDHHAPQSKASFDQAELRRATRATMSRIGNLLSGAEAMLLLTDCNGVILEVVGDNSTLTRASKINLTVGGVWSEDASGTNGIGTALWAGQPVYVHGEEHFCEGMKAWSCAAAPIRDPIDHTIIGVINLSGLTPIFQKHNAAFAATAARDIELLLEQEQSLLNIRLMQAIIGTFPSRPQGPSEGLAIVDRFGRLIFSRNSGVNIGRSDRELGLGGRFLDLPDGITEANILAALPVEHHCDDIRLIEIDGQVRGAALAFRPVTPGVGHRTAAPTLPGIVIGKTGLKIIGQSEAIRAALDTADRIASSGEPTLIAGETGVGKELFARLIHARADPQSHHPFQTINCGAMTPAMLTAALPASGFAVPLCFDEIGEASTDAQLYLLRMLEEDQIGRANGTNTGPPLRLLSLTNRTMLDEVEAGHFRRDLFYRLGTISLTIPPLRDRGDDVLLIAEHYNRKISIESGRDLLVFGTEVLDQLMSYHWPGNVRELRNLIASLHCLTASRNVTLADLSHLVTATEASSYGPPLDSRPQAVPMTKAASLKEAEVILIENAVSNCNGNLSKVARALGISRPTLYRKIREYRIGIQ